MSTIGTYNPAMLVHGQQAVTLARPLPAEGTATLTTELVAMYDKGKAAVVVTETEPIADGQPLYTNRSSVFIRGEGGWGGERGPSGPQNVPPDRAPDHEVTYQHVARPGAALPPLGRPQPAALRPGVRRHGRLRPPDPARPVHATGSPAGRCCTRCAARDPARFEHIEVRFAAPVMPGEALTVRVWELGDDEAVFTTSVGDRTVIDQGLLRHG